MITKVYFQGFSFAPLDHQPDDWQSHTIKYLNCLVVISFLCRCCIYFHCMMMDCNFLKFTSIFVLVMFICSSIPLGGGRGGMTLFESGELIREGLTWGGVLRTLETFVQMMILMCFILNSHLLIFFSFNIFLL